MKLTVDDEAGSAAAIDQLYSRGLITTGTSDSGALALTAEGRAVTGRVTAARTSLREQLYGGIDPDEMATTTACST